MDSEKTPLLNTDSTSHTYVDFDKNLRHSSYKGETSTDLDNNLHNQHNGSLPTKEAGERYRQLSRSSVLDPVVPITLSWKDVHVYSIPEDRKCCRGHDPTAVPTHILRNG